MTVKKIMYRQQLLAIVIGRDYQSRGVEFFTPGDFSQQLAYMRHPAGTKISAHVHNPVPRQVFYTQEVLFIRRGRVRVDFYDQEQVYLESHILEQGDVILLASGGHGFEVLEDLEMIEVKQGPYAGEEDKTRFKEIASHAVRLAED